MMSVEHYIESVCSKIKSTKARKNLQNELSVHLEESISHLMDEKNLSREDAEIQAIVQMGSADCLASDINDMHKDRSTLLLVLRSISLAFTAFFGIWNLIFFLSFQPYMPYGYNFFTPEPMFVISNGWFDLRPFFLIPLLVSILLFVIPAIKQSFTKRSLQTV